MRDASAFFICGKLQLSPSEIDAFGCPSASCAASALHRRKRMVGGSPPGASKPATIAPRVGRVAGYWNSDPPRALRLRSLTGRDPAVALSANDRSAFLGKVPVDSPPASLRPPLSGCARYMAKWSYLWRSTTVRDALLIRASHVGRSGEDDQGDFEDSPPVRAAPTWGV